MPEDYLWGEVPANSQSPIPLIFAKLFRGPDAEAVLLHLRHLTVERTLSPNASDAELRQLEGARALVKTIETLIKRGQS
jgi:hypothetical protein